MLWTKVASALEWLKQQEQELSSPTFFHNITFLLRYLHNSQSMCTLNSDVNELMFCLCFYVLFPFFLKKIEGVNLMLLNVPRRLSLLILMSLKTQVFCPGFLHNKGLLQQGLLEQKQTRAFHSLEINIKQGPGRQPETSCRKQLFLMNTLSPSFQARSPTELNFSLDTNNQQRELISQLEQKNR